MTAGRRDTLITLQTATVVQDDYGEETPTWGPIGGAAEPTEEWASVIWGAGAERRQAAQESASQAATFQVLDNEVTRAVNVKDRIVWEGDWDITGIATPKRGEREFTGVRAA